MTMMIKRGASYTTSAAILAGRYQRAITLPTTFATVGGDPGRVALIFEDANRAVTRYRFEEVHRHANQLAKHTTRMRLESRRPCHTVAWSSSRVRHRLSGLLEGSLVAAPTSVLFGPDAIAFRLNDSGATTLITDIANYPKVAEFGRRPSLQQVFVIDGVPRGQTLLATIQGHSEKFRNVDTAAEEAAWISYTSGTTGPPKGACTHTA